MDIFYRVFGLLWSLEGVNLDARHGKIQNKYKIQRIQDSWKWNSELVYIRINLFPSTPKLFFIPDFKFFVFLIIILVGEVAVGLLLGFDESSYKDVITNSVEATVMKKYHNNTTATVQTFDLIQEGVKKSLLVFSFNIKKNI